MKKRRGSSLASTLLLISICVGLAFTVVGLSFHHLNMGNRLSNSQQARNLAESAISLTIQKIFKNQGDYPLPGQHTTTVNFPDLGANDFGVTSFNATVASNRGVPVSFSNLKADVPATSPSGRNVPKEAVHIVGLGVCRGVRKRVECILHIPLFQSAIASQAPMDLKGPTLVAAADSSSDDDLLTTPEDYLTSLLPAHVTSNQDATLGDDVLIKGYAQAVGAINVNPAFNTTVEGGLRPNSGQAEMPDLNVQDFDPNELGGTQQLYNPSPGVYRAPGGLFRTDDDIVGSELNLSSGINDSGSLVYVDGNITVGEIRGVGAVIATGNITVTGSTNLSTDGTVAMLSGANLTLKGARNNADAIIKGIAYAKKSLAVHNVTLVGTMIQAGRDAADTLTVEESNFIHTDDTVEFEFDMPFGADAGQGSVNVKMNRPLTDYFDDATQSYARDVDGDGRFTVPPDVPRNPIQINDYKFTDASGATINLGDVGGIWVNLPGPPVDPPEGDWATVLGKNPYDAADVQAYFENVFMPRIINKDNQSLVRIERFYRRFTLMHKKQGKLSFNPSRFLNLSQAARIVLWKDL